MTEGPAQSPGGSGEPPAPPPAAWRSRCAGGSATRPGVFRVKGTATDFGRLVDEVPLTRWKGHERTAKVPVTVR